MGYGPDQFAATVSTWIDRGWLPRGGKIADFGSQEIYGNQDRPRASTADFLRAHGLDENTVRDVLPTDRPVSIAKVFEAIGIEYSAIDVDEARGATFFDLNCFAAPMAWRATFDFVHNEGTVEHLINPINGFQVAHELLKVGGVALHSMPLSGHCDHGLFHPTVRFYETLLGTNRYELLEAKVILDEQDGMREDFPFDLVDIEGRARPCPPRTTQAWIRIVYRKTYPAEFIVPFDHLDVDAPDELARRLAGSFASYTRMRLSETGRRDPIGDEFERQAELQAREQAHQYRLAAGMLNPGTLAPLCTAVLLSLLNGVALLQYQRNPFLAAGFLLSITPIIVVWTALAQRRTLIGAAIRYGARLSWALSGLAFVAGAFV